MTSGTEVKNATKSDTLAWLQPRQLIRLSVIHKLLEIAKLMQTAWLLIASSVVKLLTGFEAAVCMFLMSSGIHNGDLPNRSVIIKCLIA